MPYAKTAACGAVTPCHQNVSLYGSIYNTVFGDTGLTGRFRAGTISVLCMMSEYDVCVVYDERVRCVCCVQCVHDDKCVQ